MDFDKQVKELCDTLSRLQDYIYVTDSEIDKKKRTKENLVKREGEVREKLKELMQGCGLKSTPIIEGEKEVGYIMLAENPASLVIPDSEAIPDEFCKIERKPIKAKIKTHLKENQTNWASMESSGTNVRIKYK